MQPEPENINELKTLASDPSQQQNRALLQHVTDLFMRTLDRQSSGERDVFGDVLEKIAYQLEDNARAMLSGRLAIVDRAPPKLLQRLANDSIEVAKPVLEFSPCLDTSFLVSVVRTKSQDHLFAIAGRPQLMPAVTDEIVIHGEQYVLYRMTSNPNATFSAQGYEALAANAAGNPELGHALGTRPDLPEAMHDRIQGSTSELRPTEFFALDFDNLGK